MRMAHVKTAANLCGGFRYTFSSYARKCMYRYPQAGLLTPGSSPYLIFPPIFSGSDLRDTAPPLQRRDRAGLSPDFPILLHIVDRRFLASPQAPDDT